MEAPGAVPAGVAVAERIPLSGLRGAVARNLQATWQAVPHVAESIQVEMSACLALREGLRRDLGPDHPVSVNDLILRAVALTLREHPRLNARLAGDAVEVMAEINVGVAVSLPDGLVVPVIRNADRKSIAELGAETRELAAAARANTLSTQALQSGTFTVTNLGPTGVGTFSPIIHAPEIAILGVGGVEPRAIVRDGQVVAAPSVFLSLVFDHRAVDGYPAAQFLAALRARLEQASDL